MPTILPQTAQSRDYTLPTLQNTTTERGDQWALLALLRFFLAAIVMSAHFVGDNRYTMSPVLSTFGSHAAVLCFFVISGYSMGHSLSGEHDPKRFYLRRFWRIYPIFIATMLMAIVVDLVFEFHGIGLRHAFKELYLPAACELLMLQGIITPQLPQFGQAWSLAAECWFYAVSPILSRSPVKTLLVVLTGSAFCSLAASCYSGIYPAQCVGSIGLISLLGPFVGGLAYYRFKPQRWSTFLLLPGLFMFTFSEYRDTGNALAPFSLYLIAAALLMFGDKVQLSNTLRAFCLFCGDLSYPLYLVHPAVLFACLKLHAPAKMWQAIVLGSAVLFLYAIDYPARRRRRRIYATASPIYPEGTPQPAAVAQL